MGKQTAVVKNKKGSSGLSHTTAQSFKYWDHHIEDLHDHKGNCHVFQRMAERLRKFDCKVSAVELKNKIHRHTAKYKKEKGKIGTSGEVRSECELYAQVNDVLGRYKVHNIEMLPEDSIPSSPVSPPSFAALAPPTAPTSPTEPASHTAPPSPTELPSPPASTSPTEPASLIELSSPTAPPSPTATALSSMSEAIVSPSVALPVFAESSPASSSTSFAVDAGRMKSSFQVQMLTKIDRLEDEIRKQGEIMEEIDRELLSLEKEKTEAMKKYLKEFKDLKILFMNFLERK